MYSYLELENKSFEELHVVFCGMEECPSNYYYGPSVRTHYLIHYCLSGKGKYHVNGKIYEIGKGDAFLIMPNVITYYQADNDNPWTYVWIGFDGTKAKPYLSRCNLDSNNLVIHSDNINELKEIVISMLNHNKLSYSNEFFIQGKLFEFFSYLSKSADVPYKKEKSKDNNLYVNKAMEYIINNYQNVVNVNEIADYLSLNRSYLTTIFKKALKVSPQEFLLMYRMKKAMELLMNTDYTINQIAISCGYSNQLSFSKAFHKFQGLSPREFRKRNRLENNILNPKNIYKKGDSK
ncbi:MAG: AraC family transcriptional regulator [Clostridium sp.]|jgi:AraC family transcriptional regulator of arabinose operon